MRTRRDTLRRGAIGAGAVVGANAVSLALRASDAAGSEDDAAILETAIAAEQATVLAYSTGAGSGLLEKPIAEMARLFAEQERRHLEALMEPLTGLGGTVPEPPSVADVSGLGALGSQRDFLELAIGLENMAVAAYGQAQRKLETPALLRIATEICSNEGQHLVVLRQALGAGPAAAVPVAFETGLSPPPEPGAR
jgi:rubrerythrin